jgi:type I restriction-modification system DNA methylase subunit
MNIAGFIWNIADDVLRGVYVRGKYRDIILPMTVIRRLDAVLEPTKAAVLAKKAELDGLELSPAAQEPALSRAAGPGLSQRIAVYLETVALSSEPRDPAGRFRELPRRVLDKCA